MFSQLKANLKNIGGWTTRRRLVVINVDDFGNVRVASRSARERLAASGLDLSERMDRFDSLETREDLLRLFEVLESVKDRSGRSPVLTPYTVMANPDFDRIRKERSYSYELLPQTFERLADDDPDAYAGAWQAWKEGVARGLLRPQFHGREHLSLSLFNYKLQINAPDLLANLKHNSMAGLKSELPGIGFTQAFALTPRYSLDQQLQSHREIIETGLEHFQQLFGFRSRTFTAPSQILHPDLYPAIEVAGVVGIDKPFRSARYFESQRTGTERRLTGRRRGQKHVTIVRNVVFEPAAEKASDHVARALEMMSAAFRWRKPAIISSHRVNFSGYIEPERRSQGLAALSHLLRAMIQRWPDIEFVSADELVTVIEASTK